MIPNDRESRREFFKSGLRRLILGGIVFISGLLGWRRLSTADDTSVCALATGCQVCAIQKNCAIRTTVESQRINPVKK